MTDIIKSCDGYAKKLTSRFYRTYPWLDFVDLLQEARMGVVIAAKKYDPTRGQFITFAHYYIIAGLLEYLSRQCNFWPVTRVGRGTKEEGQRMFAVPLSDATQVQASNMIDKLNRSIDLKKRILSLPTREAVLLLLRREGYTLKEIGKVYHVTPERMRQIEADALQRCAS